MKDKRKIKAAQKAILAKLVSSRIIRKKSGEILRQYPANPGYHGSGDEAQLNPEE